MKRITSAFGAILLLLSTRAYSFPEQDVYMQIEPTKNEEPCARVLESAVDIPGRSSLLNVNLLTHHAQEVANMTPEEVLEANRRDLESFLAHNSPPKPTRAHVVPIEMLQPLIQSLNLNPVIKNDYKYQRPGVKIGYCFGRATIAHLTLSLMGVDKNRIRKIWAVGQMGTWQFHVATIVPFSDGNWYAIDNIFPEGKEVRSWAHHWEAESTRKNLRIYITEAEKFGSTTAIYDGRSMGSYDSIQLGLKMNRQDDWYLGFFQDAMEWSRTADLSTVGLKRLVPVPSKAKPGMQPMHVAPFSLDNMNMNEGIDILFHSPASEAALTRMNELEIRARSAPDNSPTEQQLLAQRDEAATEALRAYAGELRELPMDQLLTHAYEWGNQVARLGHLPIVSVYSEMQRMAEARIRELQN